MHLQSSLLHRPTFNLNQASDCYNVWFFTVNRVTDLFASPPFVFSWWPLFGDSGPLLDFWKVRSWSSVDYYQNQNLVAFKVLGTTVMLSGYSCGFLSSRTGSPCEDPSVWWREWVAPLTLSLFYDQTFIFPLQSNSNSRLRRACNSWLSPRVKNKVRATLAVWADTGQEQVLCTQPTNTVYAQQRHTLWTFVHITMKNVHCKHLTREHDGQ